MRLKSTSYLRREKKLKTAQRLDSRAAKTQQLSLTSLVIFDSTPANYPKVSCLPVSKKLNYKTSL